MIPFSCIDYDGIYVGKEYLTGNCLKNLESGKNGAEYCSLGFCLN